MTDISCPRCFVGRYRLDTAVYICMYDDKLLSMPNMPAYHCDICGYSEFDESALWRLQELLGEGADLSADHFTLSQSPPIDAPDTKSARRPKL